MVKIDLFNDDCLRVLEELSCDGVKVDLVLCDPPYGTTNNEWDTALPFDRLFELLDGVSHSSTTCCLFGSEPFSSRLRFSNFDDYKYDLYWLKNRTTGFVHAKNMPLKNVELVSVFSKGNIGHKGRVKNRMTYNPQGLVRCNKVERNARKKFGNMYGRRDCHVDEYVKEFTNYPSIFLDGFKCVHNTKAFHTTQKPVGLLEYLVLTFSNVGDTVLDFTMGSGSTGVACRNTGRDFIGIELDDEYFSIAQKRINGLLGETK